MYKRVGTIGIVVLLVVAAAFLTSHRGGLAHFSPHTLEYYTQSERTFYTTGIPFYRSRHKHYDHPLVVMLIDEGFVAPQANANDRWELIFHWNDTWRDGYGSLYDIFTRHRDQVMEWSRTNPECARIYWSEGFRLLRSDSEVDVTTGQMILNDCWRIRDPEEMRKTVQEIKDYMAKRHPA